MEYQNYQWYSRINDHANIYQGDLIPKCPIIIPPDNLIEGEYYKSKVRFYDVVVLSQSCDLENKKIKIVQVCPYFSWNQYYEALPDNKKSKKSDRYLDDLKKGFIHNLHLLHKNEEYGLSDFLVVDFHKIFGISINYLFNHITQFEYRIRLLPPYREHLSQSFARYFMRVGLPIDIK